MQIVILAAGRGSRFKDSKFNEPKPLISWDGKHMLEHVVDNFRDDGVRIIIISRKEHNVQINGVELIEIDYYTSGPAITALLTEDIIDYDDDLIITNCDQIVEDWELKRFLNATKRYDGVLGCFISSSPKNSYVRIGTDNLVSEVREKQVISNIATNGLHYWKKAQYFFDSAKEMIEKNDTTNGEFYVAPTYNYLIQNDFSVGVFMFNQHYPIGIPEDLQYYLNYKKVI